MNRRNLLKLITFSSASAAAAIAFERGSKNHVDKLETHTVIDFNEFGVSPESTDGSNRQIIQDVLNRHSGRKSITTFTFSKQGVYYLNGSLVIPNNTDLLIPSGVTITNLPGVNKPVLVSEHWAQVKNGRKEKNEKAQTSFDIAKKSDFVSIRGLGSIDYNRTGVWTKDNLDTMCIILVSISRLFIGEGLLLGNAFKYSALISNIDNLICDNIRFDNKSDGLHLQPPIVSASISNLSGHTGDDMLALTGGDYYYYDVGFRGDFGTVIAKNISAVNSLCAVKIAGSEGCLFRDISISGISGSYQHSSVRIWTDGSLKKTDATRIVVNGINADVPKGYPLVEVQTMSEESVINIDSLYIAGVVEDTTKKLQKTLDINGGKGGDLVSIGRLDLELTGDNFVGCEIGSGSNGSVVNMSLLNIIMKSCRFIDRHYFSSACIINNGQVDVISIQGNSITHDSTSLIQYRGGELGVVMSDKTIFTKGFIFSEEVESKKEIMLIVTGTISKTAKGIAKSKGNVTLQKINSFINCEKDIILEKFEAI
ncbi:hypothetical protein M8S88_06110 [Enterobacter hormaechei]|uniref:hypothetical protein n=1 Tax=Enterobacter hormaechei TaxID=158836 RepID=UPI00079ACD37|nr:hypothetical protein [Enterobacter hormaechei]MCM7852781.1 hypothetical protein [Enterobacter hormaechei]SAB69699.1 Uncharacterised protein [Enterobacter hormaechei]SAG63369.1 Uncharacterised protein [Enterobacter hormaechei]